MTSQMMRTLCFVAAIGLPAIAQSTSQTSKSSSWTEAINQMSFRSTVIPKEIKSQDPAPLEMAINNRDYQKALAILDQTSDWDSDDEVYALLRARCLWGLGDSPSALSTLAQIQETIRVLEARLFLHFQLNHRDILREQASYILNQEPHNAAANYVMGQLSSLEDSPSKTISYYKTALSDQQPFPKCHFYLGNALAAEGDYEAALSHLDRATTEDPLYALAFYEKGLVYLRLGDPTSAIQSLDRACELKPESMRPRIKLANVLAGQGDFPGALAHLNEGLSYSENYEAYYLRAMIKGRQNKFDECMADLSRSLELEPGFSRSRLARIQLAKRTGKFDLAEQDFEVLLEENPEDAKLRFNFGNLYLTNNKLSQAVDTFREALKHNPKLHQARTNMARALMGLNRFEEAENELKQSISTQPKDANAHFLLGLILEKKGQRNQAISQLKHAVQLDPRIQQYIANQPELKSLRESKAYLETE